MIDIYRGGLGGTLLTTLDMTISATTHVALSAISGHELTLAFSGGGSFGVAGLNFDQVAATPLPAALRFFTTGLGGLGFLGWRCKHVA